MELNESSSNCSRRLIEAQRQPEVIPPEAVAAALDMDNRGYVNGEVNGELVKRHPNLTRAMSTELLTYTWKDVNVWTGTPPGGNGNGNGNAIGAGDVDIEKSSSSGGFSVPFFGNKSVGPKQLLKNVTGIVRPGELVAIMGASGAGKTTLLNVLNFRNTSTLKISGQRCLNGVPVGPDTLTSLSAYIQQDDLFFGTLTVREHLVFQARVRMDAHIPYKTRMKRVDEVLQEFGLSKCENTTIGFPGRIKGISGGEMKRLAFASEVLTDPPLMFCDEPTSGLDAYMAENIVTTLKSLASKGKTIICTIHQPSSQVFALFDRILLMAEGRTAFLGPTAECLEFFAQNGYTCPPNYNPADFYIQTLAIQPGREPECREKVSGICDKFDDHPIGIEIKKSADSIKAEKESAEFFDKTSKAKKVSPYKISWAKQFSAVLWRSWIAYIKDPFVLRMRLIQTIVMSLLIGIIFFGQEVNQDGVQNLNGALFMILTNMTMQNTFGVIDVFCLELPIFLREHFNGMYRTDVYFLAKMIAELPLFIILPVIFVSINYYMIGFNSDIESFLKIQLVIILVSNFGVSLGYFISCIASSLTLALALGPALIIPFMLFSGFLLNAGSIPDYLIWMKYSSFFYYGNEALAVAQWDTIDEIECNRDNSTCPHSGAVVLKSLDYYPKNFNRDIYVLVAQIFLCRIIAYLALLSKTRRK